MLIRRDTAADQLIKVIQVLQLARKTGILSVERGEASTFEEGMLILVRGEITEAKVGQISGLEALTQLRLWKQCRFAFIPQPEQELPHTPLQGSGHATSARLTREQSDARATKPVPVPGKLMKQRIQHNSATKVLFQVRPVEEALHLITAAKLTRAHRHVFLLVDGQRTIAELAQLTSRKLEELTKLLSDLERIEVIR